MRKREGKHAWTVTVGEKGQIVIPKQARELFAIQPGDTLLLLCDVKRGIAIPPASTWKPITARLFQEAMAEDEEAEV